MLSKLILVIVLAPLLGSLIAGLGGKRVGRRGAHGATILLMLISLTCAAIVFKMVIFDGARFNGTIYTWGVSGSLQLNVGFLIDQLTAVMMLMVTFVSTVVHIYSVGYMADDPH